MIIITTFCQCFLATLLLAIVIGRSVDYYRHRMYLKKGRCTPYFKKGDILIRFSIELKKSQYHNPFSYETNTKLVKIFDIVKNDKGVYFIKYKRSMYDRRNSKFRSEWSENYYSMEAFKLGDEGYKLYSKEEIQ